MVCVYGVSNELRGAFQYFENFLIIWGMSSGRPPFLWELTRFCEVCSKVCITFAKCQPLFTFAFAKHPSLKWRFDQWSESRVQGNPWSLVRYLGGIFCYKFWGLCTISQFLNLGNPWYRILKGFSMIDQWVSFLDPKLSFSID